MLVWVNTIPPVKFGIFHFWRRQHFGEVQPSRSNSDVFRITPKPWIQRNRHAFYEFCKSRPFLLTCDACLYFMLLIRLFLNFNKEVSNIFPEFFRVKLALNPPGIHTGTTLQFLFCMDKTLSVVAFSNQQGKSSLQHKLVQSVRLKQELRKICFAKLNK